MNTQDFAKCEYGLIRFYYSKILVTVQNYQYKEAKTIYSVFKNDIISYCPKYLANRYLFTVFSGMTRFRKMVTPICGFFEITRTFSLFLYIYTFVIRGKKIVD